MRPLRQNPTPLRLDYNRAVASPLPAHAGRLSLAVHECDQLQLIAAPATIRGTLLNHPADLHRHRRPPCRTLGTSGSRGW